MKQMQYTTPFNHMESRYILNCLEIKKQKAEFDLTGCDS